MDLNPRSPAYDTSALPIQRLRPVISWMSQLMVAGAIKMRPPDLSKQLIFNTKAMSFKSKSLSPSNEEYGQ